MVVVVEIGVPDFEVHFELFSKCQILSNTQSTAEVLNIQHLSFYIDNANELLRLKTTKIEKKNWKIKKKIGKLKIKFWKKIITNFNEHFNHSIIYLICFILM